MTKDDTTVCSRSSLEHGNHVGRFPTWSAWELDDSKIDSDPSIAGHRICLSSLV